MEINLNFKEKYHSAINPNTNKLKEHFKAKYQTSSDQIKDSKRHEIGFTESVLSLKQLEEIHLQEQLNIEILNYAIGMVEHVENNINQAGDIMNQHFNALNDVKNYLINLHANKKNHPEASLSYNLDGSIHDQNSADNQCITS